MKRLTNQTQSDTLISRNMLVEFLEEIRSYSNRHKRKPDYIIISSYDYEAVLKEMVDLGILPKWENRKDLTFNDIRIIQSIDFKSGHFDVVGS